MTSLKKLERDRAASDLAAVDAMISRLGDEDALTRLSLEQRRDEIRQELEKIEDRGEPTASAVLFFTGRPVIGQRGVESEFAGRAVTTFQELVTKQYAHDAGVLGQRGPLPNRAGTRLHITNIARGSFGFQFEEITDQSPLLASALKAAVEHATELMAAFGEDEEGRFEAAVENVDSRVLDSARDFFSLMRQDGATFRIVSGETDRSFDIASIERAAQRASVTTISDVQEEQEGQLAGVLPQAHLFEYRTEGPRGVIRGKVAREILADELARYNHAWVDKPRIASLLVRQVLKEDQVVRESFTLVGVRERPIGLHLAGLN